MNNKISWTEQTWNPVVGCTRISPGCRGCYAHRMAKRQAGMARAKRAKGQDPGRSAHYEKVENWDGIELVPEALGDPLRWRKPRRVFVCSMSDLFHPDVPFSYIREVWDKMYSAPRHTFQILTKRPARMLEFMNSEWLPGRGIRYPLDNVHLGVTAEDQERADERIPILLQIPAAFYYVSLEPLLSDIRFHSRWLSGYHYESGPLAEDIRRVENNSLNLVIAGGETGPGARPMHPAWPRSLRDQCASAGVGFHFKSWGEWLDAFTCAQMGLLDGRTYPSHKWPDGSTSFRVGAKRAGHLLDGEVHRD